MYALSWIFLLAAIGSLAYGLSQPGLTFIYISIVASVVAMLFLLGGVLRKKPVEPATAGAPYGPPANEAGARAPEATSVMTRDAPAPRPRRPPEQPPQRKPGADRRPPKEPTPAAVEAAAELSEEATALQTGVKEPQQKAAARKPAAKKAAAERPTAKKAAAKKKEQKKAPARKAGPRGGGAARVEALPERGTYHRSTCRFVRGRRDTEDLTRTTAKRRGYEACGVCKPDDV